MKRLATLLLPLALYISKKLYTELGAWLEE